METAFWVAASQQLQRVLLRQGEAAMEKTAHCRPSGILRSPLLFQNCSWRQILLRGCSKSRAGNSSNWHPSSEEYSRASALKCTDSDMVTLIITVQQIRMDLQTADTEEDRFAVIMRAVCEQIKATVSPLRTCNILSTLVLSPLPRREEAAVRRLSKCLTGEISLVVSPHRARCLDHAGLLKRVDRSATSPSTKQRIVKIWTQYCLAAVRANSIFTTGEVLSLFIIFFLNCP